MHVDEYNAKFKAKGAKLLDILIDELLKHLPFSCNVNHKIEVVPRLIPLSKSPYWLIKTKS
jgi:hypothetical protein